MMEVDFKMKLCPRHVDVKFLKEMIDIVTRDNIEVVRADILYSNNFKDMTLISIRHENLKLLNYAARVFADCYKRNQRGFPENVDRLVKRSCSIAGNWSGLEDYKQS